MSSQGHSTRVASRQRVDKWLWHARLARTRSAAKAFAISGRLRINREKNETAAHLVQAGDVLTISLPGRIRIVRVRAIAERRGSATEAAGLYEELTR